MRENRTGDPRVMLLSSAWEGKSANPTNPPNTVIKSLIKDSMVCENPMPDAICNVVQFGFLFIEWTWLEGKSGLMGGGGGISSNKKILDARLLLKEEIFSNEVNNFLVDHKMSDSSWIFSCFLKFSRDTTKWFSFACYCGLLVCKCLKNLTNTLCQ
jgi:hypothetical protein